MEIPKEKHKNLSKSTPQIQPLKWFLGTLQKTSSPKQNMWMIGLIVITVKKSRFRPNPRTRVNGRDCRNRVRGLGLHVRGCMSE